MISTADSLQEGLWFKSGWGLFEPEWVFSRYSGFLLTKDMHVRLIGASNLAIGVSVSPADLSGCTLPLGH